MSAKRLSLVLSVALAASPGLALADGHAHSSGGSSSGGGHSSGGGGHVSNGGGHSNGGSGNHAVPRSQGSGGSGPQYRHPQAGSGTGYRYGHGGYGHGYGYGHGNRYGYYPYYGYGYGYGYGYPYWGSVGFYYGGGYPYYSYDDGYYSGGGYSSGGGYDGSYRSASRPAGGVRLLVDPEDAKVYVDGYYAGTVDDYDGLGQHLDMPAGKHEIALRRDGYQAQRFKVYVTPDDTLKIRFTMVKGAGEAPQDIVVGDPSSEQYSRESRRDDQRYDDDRAVEQDRNDRPADRPPARRSSEERHRLDAPPPRDAGASLRLTVKPADASVYVDGSFYGTARQAGRLELTPGRHRIEVVRPGYHTYDNEVEVGVDAPTDLDVTLER